MKTLIKNSRYFSQSIFLMTISNRKKTGGAITWPKKYYHDDYQQEEQKRGDAVTWPEKDSWWLSAGGTKAGGCCYMAIAFATSQSMTVISLGQWGKWTAIALLIQTVIIQSSSKSCIPFWSSHWNGSSICLWGPVLYQTHGKLAKSFLFSKKKNRKPNNCVLYIMDNKLLVYLREFNLISKSQHGVLSHKSTTINSSEY